MAVFGRSIDVEIVHAPGTVEEKRWSTTMGGDLATKALFHPVDRVVTGDEVHASLFDEPRVISSVNPVTTLDGTVSHWEARMTAAVPLAARSRPFVYSQSCYRRSDLHQPLF
jgi:hypothetical protein